MRIVKKTTSRVAAVLLSGMLAIASVPVATFGTEVDVDSGQTIDVVVEDTGESIPEEESVVEQYSDEAPQEESTVESYTVTLDANGGYFANEWDDALNETPETAETVTKLIPVGGTVATFPVLEQENADVTFLGWSLEQNGETLVSQGYEEYAPVDNCILYAVWQVEEIPVESEETEVQEEDQVEDDTEEISTEDQQMETENEVDESISAILGGVETSEKVDTTDSNTVNVEERDNNSDNQDESTQVSIVEDGEEESFSTVAVMSVVDSGTCGDNLTWTLDEEGTLTISGTGEMTSTPWRSRDLKEIRKVIISDGVTTIITSAFSSCSSLISVTLGNDIQEIGESAFSFCSSLESVSISDSVEKMGKAAFNGCKSLSSISFSHNMDTIPEEAFKDCSNYLKTVTIPSNIKRIERSAFNGCNSLTYLYLNDGLTEIGAYAFLRCWRLKSINTPSSLQIIRNNAFDMCYDVGTVVLSEGLISIEHDALNFGSDNSLNEINIPSTVEKIGSNALYKKCKYYVSENNNYYSSEKGALYNKDKTSLIRVPTVNNGDFFIPDTVIRVEDFAFDYCGDITEISFPPNLDIIGKYAFRKCCGLQSIELPDSVTEINAGAFNDCTDLANIVLGSNIQYIGESAFCGCKLIDSLHLSENISYIGPHAFSGCQKLESINLEDTRISRLESGTFSACSSLSKLSLPDSVEHIGDSVFSGTSIKKIVIPQNVSDVGVSYSYATGDLGPLYGINAVVFEEGIKTIPSNICNAGYIFNEPSSTRSAVLNVEIPLSVTEIGINAFNNCSTITDVYYAGTQDEWALIDIKTGNGKLTGANIHYKSTLNGPLSNSNEDIISRVREYTSDDIYAQYNALIEDTTITGEERFHRMNSLLCNYGFTNPKEGIKYVSNVMDKRHAYLMLTSDDTYCANNYVNWLESGALAGPRRALLIADGLIFNNEINDWLSFTTYAESDYPGVKKYKTMLYDFMDTTSKKIEIQSGVKFASDLASKSTGVAKIEAENIVSKLNACGTIAEEREILKLAESEGIYTELSETSDENGNILLSYQLDESSGFGEFQKLMGYGTKTLSVTNMTITDILDIIELDSKLATYSQYKRFLQEVVHDTSVPYQMRWAASLIIGELDEGYLGKIKDVAMDIIGQTELNSTIKKTILSKIGANSISGWLSIISIDSFFVNQITNIGDLVKNEAYVEGYYYLSQSYKNRLEESKSAFQQSPTEANAWEFYYNYNILYNLRYKGEEAYLKMSKIGGLAGKLFDFGYTDKKAVVDNTLEMLKKRCQFTFDGAQSIPESCQFASKAVVKCPVDVDVVSSDGTVMATLVDGEESDFTNSYGRFAVVYDYYSQDYNKVICLNESNDYTLRAKGNNKGLVNIELARADDANQDVYVINNIPIDPEEVLSASVEQITENSTITRYTANASEGKEEEVVVTNDNYIPVNNITLNQEELMLAPGESALLNVTFEPVDSTKQGVFWNSTDLDVASVTDGRIEAVSEGSALIYCTSQDNSDLIKTCAVTVAKHIYSIENFTIKGIEDKVYIGEEVYQNISLSNAESTLTEGADYEIAYTDNINAGTATVTITGIGNYEGTITKTFTISPAEIDTADFSEIGPVTYTGKEQTPVLTVNIGDKSLTSDKDYTVAYKNNKDVGTATITITGKENYTGTKTATFEIKQAAISEVEISGLSDKTYTSQAITQAPIVKSGSIMLKEGTDYTVSYKNNTNPGTATVTITGMGNYTGTKEATFTIKPVGWIKESGEWYYYKNAGTKLTNGWAKDSKGWYWLDASGKITKSKWIKSSGSWYYLGTDGIMTTGWQKVGGKWYYMNSSGVMTTGWQKVGSNWYYMNSSGVMTTGWQKVGGKWYYMNSSGIMTTGWQQVGGKWYYMNSSGIMTTGWQKVGGNWYYMNSSGIMTTGWQKIGGKWYYMKSSGIMTTGWQVISGKWYYFNASGVWVR